MARGRKITLDKAHFDELVEKGLNCKEISKEMGLHSHTFGAKFKAQFGVYPSVYIAKLKKGVV